MEIVVFLAYFLLTLLMTWPSVLHLADGIPGDGFDGWQNYWNMWWVREALLVLRQSPYFTYFLYPPLGTNLLFHTLNIFNSLLTLPIQLNFGLAVAYHGVVWFSFTCAGYGGYLLSLYTLNHLSLPRKKGLRLAAFVGGLVFTMSPFHMAHLLGHMQVFNMAWPPFYVLWLLRTLNPWASTPPPFSWRNTALTCLLLILSALVDWYQALYLIIFTGLVALWVTGSRIASSRVADNKATERQISFLPSLSSFLPSPFSLLPSALSLLLIGLGFVIVLSPLLIPMIREAGARPDLDTGLEQNVTLSADLLAFVLPSEMHPLWGDWAKSIASQFSSTTSERLIFAGFVPLALALYVVLRYWRERAVKFWALVVVTFIILALGPYLHIDGKIVSIGGWAVPMPYLLLYKTIPFIGLTRSLSRYDLLVMLGLGVLAAMALAYMSGIQSQVSRARSYILRFAFYVTPLLICFEFLAVPYPVSKIEIPQFYYDLGAQTEDFIIAELPMNWDRPTPLLHQTVHHKPLLTAYTSRNAATELAWRTPVLQHWRYLGPDIIDQPLGQIAPTVLADFKLRYIVLDYWQMPPGPERDGTEQWVAAALPAAAPVYDDGRLKVYQSPPLTTLPQPYLSLGDGWSSRQQNESGQTTRTFSPQAELQLHHPRPALEVEITAASNTPQTVRLLAGDQAVGQFEVTATPLTQTITLPPLSGEIITLTLQAHQPATGVTIRRLGLRVME